MTTDASQPTLTNGPADSEILRLHQQLEAREEVIRQLNLLVTGQPTPEKAEPAEHDQEQLADAVGAAKVLKGEVNRLLEVVAQKDAEITGLRRQLQASGVANVAAAPAHLPSRAKALLRKVRSR